MTFSNISFHHRSSKYRCRTHCLFEANANNGIPSVKECTTRNNNRNKTMKKYKCEVHSYSPTDVVNQQQPVSTKMRQANAIRRYFRFS